MTRETDERQTMTDQELQRRRTKPRRTLRVVIACTLLATLAAAITIVVVDQKREPEVTRSDRDVPLGVEEAVIIRYSGSRLVARPYRRGASVNLRIANQTQQGNVRVYDVRYVVSLPGEFDLTEYLTSADGRPISDLPSFKVRGLTSLTKDIETRIQEIEEVGVHVWHWYYETLTGLGIAWGFWLMGLIFTGRPKRPPKITPPPPPPSVAERIARYMMVLRKGELTVNEKAELEILLLEHWRDRLDLRERRMAEACRQIQHSDDLGTPYDKLQAWLHVPNSQSGADEFLEAYESRAET